MVPIVVGTSPSPGVITLTPRSDVLVFLSKLALNAHDRPLAETICGSTTASLDEKVEMMQMITADALDVRRGHLYDVNPSGVVLVWVPGDAFPHGWPLWVSEVPVTSRTIQIFWFESWNGDYTVRWHDAIDICNEMTRRDSSLRKMKDGTLRVDRAYDTDGTAKPRSVEWDEKAAGYRLPTTAEALAVLPEATPDGQPNHHGLVVPSQVREWCWEPDRTTRSRDPNAAYSGNWESLSAIVSYEAVSRIRYPQSVSQITEMALVRLFRNAE